MKEEINTNQANAITLENLIDFILNALPEGYNWLFIWAKVL